MDQTKIYLDYLREAYKLAMKSKDPSTQNGALIIKKDNFFNMSDCNVISRAWNRFPEGVAETPERMANRKDKYSLIGHAEANAVHMAAREGRATNGAIMIVPWYACDRCGVAISEAGIKRVIGYAGSERWWRAHVTEGGGNGATDWYEGIAYAIEMFDAKGIEHLTVDGPIGGVEVRFRGKLMTP